MTDLRRVPGMVLFAGLILLVSIQTAKAHHADRSATCPDWAIPSEPIVRYSFEERGFNRSRRDPPPGVLLSATANYWRRGVWFQLPFGYINPRPYHHPHEAYLDRDQYRHLLAENSGRNGYDPQTGEFNADLLEGNGSFYGDQYLTFWMPTRRYAERNISYGGRFPCEAGRPHPADDEYLISVKILWPFLPDSESSRYRHLFNLPGHDFMLPPRDDPIYDQGPLLPFGPESYSGDRHYSIYFADRQLVVFLRCTPFVGDQVYGYPTCGGWVWQRELDLVFEILFPSRLGRGPLEADWRVPVNAGIEMIEGWRD